MNSTRTYLHHQIDTVYWLYRYASRYSAKFMLRKNKNVKPVWEGEIDHGSYRNFYNLKLIWPRLGVKHRVTDATYCSTADVFTCSMRDTIFVTIPCVSVPLSGWRSFHSIPRGRWERRLNSFTHVADLLHIIGIIYFTRLYFYKFCIELLRVSSQRKDFLNYKITKAS